jgi:hypothetical protein
MHELAFNILGPCIVSTIISLVNKTFNQERLKTFQVLWEKVNSFFFFSLERLYGFVKLMNFSFHFRVFHNKRLISSLRTPQEMSRFLLHLFPLGTRRWTTMLISIHFSWQVPVLEKNYPFFLSKWFKGVQIYSLLFESYEETIKMKWVVVKTFLLASTKDTNAKVLIKYAFNFSFPNSCYVFWANKFYYKCL